MTPLTPANLAAIERRAAAATEALARPAGALYVEQSLSAADVPALLRHIAALQAQHAGEVAAAVRAERAACAKLCDDRAEALDAGQGDDEPDFDHDEESMGYGRFVEALRLAEEIRDRADAIAATTGGAP